MHRKPASSTSNNSYAGLNSHLPNFSMTLVLNISQIICDVINSKLIKGFDTSSFVALRENIKLTVKIIFLTWS